MRIKNKSWSPQVVSLPGGKSLTLAGRGTEEVSAEDFESPEFQRLAKARLIIVLPEKKKKSADTGTESKEKKTPADTAEEPSQPAASPPENGGGAEPE
jgi:hypothetical protein